MSKQKDLVKIIRDNPGCKAVIDTKTSGANCSSQRTAQPSGNCSSAGCSR